MEAARILGGAVLVLISKNIARVLARYSEGLPPRWTTDQIRQDVRVRVSQRAAGQRRRPGRLIDRTFLAVERVERFAERIETTKALVAEVVAQRRAAQQSTMILVFASGPARYLRELAREQGGDDLIIAAHDRDPREVVFGRELAAAEGLPNFTFAVGEATDHSSYLTSRDPDIILAVGVFARLQHDAAVRTVMQLSFAHLSPGGCFICTTLTGAHARDPDAFAARSRSAVPRNHRCLVARDRLCQDRSTLQPAPGGRSDRLEADVVNRGL